MEATRSLRGYVLAHAHDPSYKIATAYDIDTVPSVDSGEHLLIAIVDVRLAPTYSDEGLGSACTARTG